MKILYSILIAVAVMLLSFNRIAAQSSSLHPEESKQDSAKSQANIATSAPAPEHNNLILIPFEPKLYQSDIDRDIAIKTGLKSYQIRANFRQGLSNELFAGLRNEMPVIAMLSEDPSMTKDLYYIYHSIGYQYIPLTEMEAPEAEQTRTQRTVTRLKSIVQPMKKEGAKHEPGTRIEQGQLKTVPDNAERYMATRIINPAMLRYIGDKYGASLFLFINQLDVLQAAENNHLILESGDYMREARIHYTLLDSHGKEVYGGIARVRFSGRTNDLNRIIKGHFPVLAQQIAGHLPPVLTGSVNGQ